MAHQGLHQVQKQTQSLILAPQLRQSLKILQSPAIELRTAILEELQSNPALEELPLEEIQVENSSDNGNLDNSEDGSELDFKEDYQQLAELEEDWREYYAQENSTRTFSAEDAERRQHFFDSLTSETSLQEHLIRQAELADTSPDVLQAMEFLIGSLDDRGFLTVALADLALMGNQPLKAVQEAANLLKTLDPPGIGAKDLQDCLLIQLAQTGKKGGLAYSIVKEQFALLLRRRVPEIARKMSISTTEVHDALEIIATLDPAPGRKFGDDTNRVVVPDVKVEKDGEDWNITLNNDYIPRLRVSSLYKEMMAQGRLKSQEKNYIQDKIRSGRFLISSIEQRQQTIERITRSLLEFQWDFFEEGLGKLRPLTMNQVAEAVGVHETTVSRAIANKYIETPHGVFEFKYFFTPGFTSGTGEAFSNKTVKELIAKIIEAEDPAKPYSDQEIARMLGERDIKIARRTVAKYREELGILATNLRREYA